MAGKYMNVQNKMGVCQKCVFCSCTLLTMLVQSSMCSVCVTVFPHLIVDK